MTVSDYQKITDIIPQRPPFLWVDQILDLDVDQRIITEKLFSLSDPLFQGNIPNYSYIPGSILLEALCQSASALVLSNQDLSGQYAQLHSVSSFQLKRDLVPPTTLRMEVDVKKKKGDKIEFKSIGFVEDMVVCEAQFTFMFAQVPSKSKIHPTASVHPSAILGKDVVVGPYTIIGEKVSIGDGSILEAHVMVEKWTSIGEGNHIHFGSVIGSQAQDVKYEGEESWVVIGDRNHIREYVTINRPTGKGEKTQIGSDCMFLTNVHIGHNVKIGNNVMIANAVHLGGHVVIEDRVTIGGMTGVHQFVRIGRGSMTGGYARLIQDVPPFMLCDGNPAYVRSLNTIGLKRQGIRGSRYKSLKDAHRYLYRSQMNINQALSEIKNLEKNETLSQLIAFLKEDTSRGISKKVDVEELKDAAQ